MSKPDFPTSLKDALKKYKEVIGKETFYIMRQRDVDEQWNKLYTKNQVLSLIRKERLANAKFYKQEINKFLDKEIREYEQKN